MKAVYFKEGDFVLVPDKMADTFRRNDPSADAVYDWESGRLVWRSEAEED